MIDDAKPLFTQIAEKVEDSILNGTLPELSRAPSTNELATFYSINPATAAKGINRLVDKGVLEKRRGIGMFVTEGPALCSSTNTGPPSPRTSSAPAE